MNLLYFLYFSLPNFARIGLPGKVLNRFISILLKKILDQTVPLHFSRTSIKAGSGLNSLPRDETYIVSLTSYPARINEIWITIETILRQSFKPDKIILWLAGEQFPDRKLPGNLERLLTRGLTIEYCDDLKSHKKYFYACQTYPDACIITLDDDLYFDRNTIKNLVELHKEYPTYIVTNRAHRITFNRDMVNPYRKWKHNVTDCNPSHLLLATGGAGTLYPPGSLHMDTFNKNVFRERCYYADDIWLKIMALRNNTLVVTNSRYNKDFVSVRSTQKQKLVTINVLENANDEQFRNLLDYYGISLLKDDVLLNREAIRSVSTR